MKNLHLLAAVSTAFVLAACGGSSNSSSSGTSGSTTTTTTNAHIEAIVSHLTSYDNGSQSDGILFQYQDLTNIQALDQIQFQLVTYSSSGVRTVLPTDQWTSSDTSNSYGTLGYNNGNFQAANATTPSPLEVSVIYNNKVYSAPYDVLPRQVRLRGVIQSSASPSTKVGGVEVDFYGFSNPTDNTTPFVLVGKVTSASDGTFRASVPSGTYGFTLLPSSIPTGYQKNLQFIYKGQTWSDGATIYPLQFAPIPTTSPVITPPGASLPTVGNYLPNGEYFLANYSNSNPATNGTILLVHD